MSIIIATTAAEAAEVIRELDGKSVTVTTTVDLPPWLGTATDTAATATADSATADDTTSPQVEDIDDMTDPARRIKSWTTGEEYILKTKTRAGLNCRQIGDILGRSDSSVRNKLHALEAERARLNLTPIRVSK